MKLSPPLEEWKNRLYFAKKIFQLCDNMSKKPTSPRSSKSSERASFSGFRAKLYEYEKLAEIYGWNGNIYHLTMNIWSLVNVLTSLSVDSSLYEEKVKNMIKNKNKEGHIISFIQGVRSRAKELDERLKEMGEPLRGRYENLKVLEEELKKLEEEAKNRKPVVSIRCLAVKNEGKVEVILENPAPLPVRTFIELEGVSPLKPIEPLVIGPRSSTRWEGRVLIKGDTIRMKTSYSFPGTSIAGTFSTEAPVEKIGTIDFKAQYLNKPVEELIKLTPILIPLRSTIAMSIGGWHIIGNLGSGGFYHTYLAEKAGLKAALKIPKESWNDKEMRPRLSNEALKLVEEEAEILKSVKKVRDGGVLHLIDFYESDIGRVMSGNRNIGEVPYIALQYCPKGNIVRVAGNFSMRNALIIIFQIGTALQECYEKGILLKHGDIKPENILVDDEGRVLITDFQTALRGRFTTAKKPMTLNYFHDAPDDRADVYALGRLLVDLVLGIEAPEDNVPIPLDQLVRASRTNNPMHMRDFLKVVETLLLFT